MQLIAPMAGRHKRALSVLSPAFSPHKTEEDHVQATQKRLETRLQRFPAELLCSEFTLNSETGLNGARFSLSAARIKTREPPSYQ